MLGARLSSVISIRHRKAVIGIPCQTRSDRVSEIEAIKYLKLPSGNAFRVSEIEAEDSNRYLLVEASDWAALAQGWAKEPGKLHLMAFLRRRPTLTGVPYNPDVVCSNRD